MFTRSLLNNFFYATAFALLLVLSGCDDDDPPLPANYANFESQELGIDDDEESITVNINFTSAANQDGQLTLSTELSELEYGVQFVTEPAATNNAIVLPVEEGSAKTSFKLIVKDDAVFVGDETIKFTISQIDGTLEVGERSSLLVRFAEIVAEEATMDPTVGGPLQPNKVFIDLSASRQTVVMRNGWDLGFYMAEGQFRVILNSSSSMLARALDKKDLNSVTAQDTLNWGAQLSQDAVFGAITSETLPAWTSQAVTWIDAPNGDMTNTAIAEISATADDNKVYIINRGKNPDGTERGWKKVRVIRDGDNYTLQHADIGAETFSTINITRDNAYLFKYIKFETGAVDIEPKKDKWDIAFTVFTNTTPVSQTLTVPYVYNDVVIQNRYNTETTEVLTSTKSYNEFDEDDLSGVTFSTSQINIGSKWRSGGGPGGGPALKEDRFYLIKDSAGNIYKLKFTALTQNGERGRPQIQFELIQSPQ